MQGKQANPARHVNGVLMGVIAVFGNFIRDIVNNDYTVEHDQNDKHQYPEGNVGKYVIRYH
ncbi:hypothetical protein D3C75_1310520 [compost metagenome]